MGDPKNIFNIPHRSGSGKGKVGEASREVEPGNGVDGGFPSFQAFPWLCIIWQSKRESKRSNR